MNTIEAGLLMLFEKVGGADVGRQHALFDQAVGIAAPHRNDAFDLASIVKQHHRLDRLEVDRAVLVTGLSKIWNKALSACNCGCKR